MEEDTDSGEHLNQNWGIKSAACGLSQVLKLQGKQIGIWFDTCHYT